MNAAQHDLEKLAQRAGESHVVVVGAGMGGLVAAIECARIGMRVTVFDSAPRAGGAIRSATVAGIDLDAGAESYATRGGHVRALIDSLGLSDAVVAPGGGPAWVAGLPGGVAAPLPPGGVLGIPANPFAPEVRRIIGWRGAWRAYVDRIRPPLTIGHERSLGHLVRSRMGERVVSRLVEPVVSGVYSARADDIDVDVAAPGLNAALTRVGSLTGAVAELRGSAAKAPGGAVAGLDGGMRRLVEAALSRLDELGGVLRTATPVERLERLETGWNVVVAPPASDSASESGEAPGGVDANVGVHETIAADAVIVATEENEARRLLASVDGLAGLAAESLAERPVVEVITLVLDAPALDARPRGAGVLAVPGTSRAKALTHATAKWEWLSRRAAGRHVVRLSFGAQGEPPATAELDDQAAAAMALDEAAVLLGTALDASMLVGSHRERYSQSQPASAIGQAVRAARERAAITAVPRLGVVGAWLAGTGLAQVVPDAQDEAERVRAQLLWGESD